MSSGCDGSAVDAEQLREKRRHAGRDAGHGAAQGPAIHPAGHPCPALAHQAARPGIQAAGDRKLGNDLAEDQAHHELAEADQDVGPPHRRSAGDERAREYGVHADHRRQIGKPQGEVLPLRHGPVEMRYIAQRLQLFGVLIHAQGGIVGHPRLSPIYSYVADRLRARTRPSSHEILGCAPGAGDYRPARRAVAEPWVWATGPRTDRLPRLPRCAAARRLRGQLRKTARRQTHTADMPGRAYCARRR